MVMDVTITRKLQELERYIRQLQRFQSYRYDEIEGDLEKIWAIERGLQISVQIIIDIGNHILASIGENQIEDYTDVLSKLGKCNILPSEFAERIKGMAGFRNILVHRYVEVDLKRLYDILQNRLHDFVEYIGYIQSYFSSEP
ncbi:DUF86 domain-containing protein [Candidatus Poribacteria bacterium]